MKKYLLGSFAIATAICLSAFSFKKEDNSKAFTSYVWHKYNAAGTAELVPLVTFTGDAAGARLAFGCPNIGSKICGEAYNNLGVDQHINISKP